MFNQLIMRSVLGRSLLSVIFMSVVFIACKHTPPNNPLPEPDYGGFPEAVGKIFINKCATAGCHNDASYQNAAGLRTDTWEHLLLGGSSGASIVAYTPEFSPLMYFINTDPSRGTTTLPTMPYDPSGSNANALSDAEYNTIKEWIASGAPDKDGKIPFSENAGTRQKFYLTQQGCDQVAVIDAESNLVMRYIPIGTDELNIESPHCLKMSSDGKYAYVSFLSGKSIQKIDVQTDQVAADVNLGSGSWNILYLAPNDSSLTATDWTSNGRIVFANANTMTTQPWLTGGGAGTFVFPHGIASTPNFDTVFVTAQYGNVVYRYSPEIPYYRKVSINGRPAAATNSGDNFSPNPHEILMAPDYHKYFLTCQSTNEIRVMDAHSDAVLDSIPVGLFPQEMALSRTKPYLFVTCMEDNTNPLPGRKGSVYVINYNTHEIVDVLRGDFFQPHALAVDDINGKVLVASTNSNPDGPAPHHATACGGRAGWYTMYDLNTLKPLNNKRYQVTVLPYSADIRFKP